MLLEYGCDAVIGSHPHVVQEMEIRPVKGSVKGEKQVPVFYSLGNFVSSGNGEGERTGGLAEFTLVKEKDGRCTIEDPVLDTFDIELSR